MELRSTEWSQEIYDTGELLWKKGKKYIGILPDYYPSLEQTVYISDQGQGQAE